MYGGHNLHLANKRPSQVGWIRRPARDYLVFVLLCGGGDKCSAICLTYILCLSARWVKYLHCEIVEHPGWIGNRFATKMYILLRDCLFTCVEGFSDNDSRILWAWKKFF